MKKDNKRHILFRFSIIIVVILVFAGAIVYKIFDTTVISADKWNNLAEKELSRIDTIAPERGDILADNGSVLATNLRYYHIRMDYRSEKFMEDTLRHYSRAIGDSLHKYFGRRSGGFFNPTTGIFKPRLSITSRAI